MENFAPPKKKMSIGKKILIGIGILVAIGIIGNLIGDDESKNGSSTTSSASDTTSPELTQAQKDSVEITNLEAEIKQRKDYTWDANQLVEYYEQNEVKADQDLKGQDFWVTGNVGDIKKDIMDNIYVTLESGNFMRSVQCYFDDENLASQLQKGQRVTFYGKGDGLMMSALMKNCVLVDNVEVLEEKLKTLKK